MLAILFLCGLAAIVTGLALWSVPVALVAGGAMLCALALVLYRGQARLPAPPSGGDE